MFMGMSMRLFLQLLLAVGMGVILAVLMLMAVLDITMSLRMGMCNITMGVCNITMVFWCMLVGMRYISMCMFMAVLLMGRCKMVVLLVDLQSLMGMISLLVPIMAMVGV